MDYRKLGRTGVNVTGLCLGCMNFGDRTDEASAQAIVDRALEAGLNFVDTADVYSGGRSEEFLGKALAANGRRDRVVLATKVHGGMERGNPNSGGNHRRHIIEGCEASLRRLRTDWIDLYQLHRSDPNVPVDETLRALDDLVRAGKVRYIGVSTFPAWKIVESLWVSREFGLNRVVCEQPPYNLLDRRPERELVPMARAYGIALIPWSPLAGGFLTGKYSRENPRAVDGRMGGERKWMTDHFTEDAFRVLDVVRALADEKGCTPGQMALAWCMQQPGITSAIIGPRTVGQLDDNLGAAAVTLTAEDNQRLDAVAPPGRMTLPYYDSGTWMPAKHPWL